MDQLAVLIRCNYDDYCINKISQNLMITFLLAFLLGGIVEYLISFLKKNCGNSFVGL